jgi:hypothetical protein
MVVAAKLSVGSCRDKHTIRDKELSPPWFYRRMKVATPEQFLEDEIYFLRRRMEHMFNQEQSLISESVIEISSLLDHKINEYMQQMSRNR